MCSSNSNASCLFLGRLHPNFGDKVHSLHGQHSAMPFCDCPPINALVSLQQHSLSETQTLSLIPSPKLPVVGKQKSCLVDLIKGDGFGHSCFSQDLCTELSFLRELGGKQLSGLSDSYQYQALCSSISYTSMVASCCFCPSLAYFLDIWVRTCL